MEKPKRARRAGEQPSDGPREPTPNDPAATPTGGAGGHAAGAQAAASGAARAAEPAALGGLSPAVAAAKRRLGARVRQPENTIEANRILVTDKALASIVGLAAHEVPGVVGMAPVSLGEGLRRVLGRTQVDEGVAIAHPHGEGRADVALHVVVAYGVNIPAVASSVRERVRYVAKHHAGIELDEVRVHVDGVSRG